LYSNLQPYVIDRKPPLGAVRNPYLPINQDLVGDWLMNEGAGNTVQDLSGNGNTGTFVNDTHFVAGKFGPALSFDGTGDHVNCGAGAIALQVNGAAQLSVVAWINKTTIGSEMIVAMHNGGTDGVFYLATLPAPERIRFAIINNIPTRVDRDVAVTISDGLWHQVVGIYDGAQIKIYWDGVEQGSPLAQTGLLHTTDDNVMIGDYTAGLWPYTGLIEGVSIYNCALSASEISKLYREPFCGYRWPNIIELASYVAAAGGSSVAKIMQQMNQFNGGAAA